MARFSGLLEAAFRKCGQDVLIFPFRSLYPAFITKDRVDASLADHAQLVLYNPLSWFGTIRRIKSLRPDILLVAYWTGLLAPLCFVLRRFTGIRTVVLLHNLSSHESFFFEPLMQRLLAASADGFLTLSGAVSQEVKAAMPDIPQYSLFHPLLEPDGELPSVIDARRELHLDAHAPVLLFFGYVRPYKGLETMLRAMPAILQKAPALRLVVAGQFYEDVARYRQLVEQLGLGGNVDLYPGYVASERTALYFAAADVVMLPYRSATQSGVVQLAYGYGLPVIVTPVGALPEMVRHGQTGWLARDTSSDGIAAAVGEFLDSRDQLNAMRPAIEAFRREFSWESFAASAGSFLEAIAAGRK
ncbi:MAG: glycosyltransferase [Chlorobium sp.]|nr:MAG: glycosyltransferase [Chlorobium sp.]